jgi:hypothetical protein
MKMSEITLKNFVSVGKIYIGNNNCKILEDALLDTRVGCTNQPKCDL